jgi:hypothetical protein
MKMKKLLLLLFLTVSISVIGQKKHSYKRGLKFLSKSEKFYQKNEFEKSLFYLNKYKKSLPGFCGSSYFIFEKSIFDLKLKNYFGLKKFDDALTIIDQKESMFSEEIQKDDSLKVEILFLKYGKDNVIKAFNNVEKIVSKSSEFDNFIYTIYLKEFDYNFKFRVSNYDFYDKEVYKLENFNNLYFISYNQPIHKLLFNKSKENEKVTFKHITKDGNNLNINFESNVDLLEYNKLTPKETRKIDYLVERNPKIISATTHQTFDFRVKDKNGKQIDEYSRVINVYFNFVNYKINNYKIEIIDYDEKGNPIILETLSFSKSEFESKTFESKELNIDLKEYINEINNEIEKEYLITL